jgi:hypothetical protein
MEYQNRGGTGKYLQAWRKNNYGPRFGFAYRLFGSNSTSIRGGYGIYYGELGPRGDTTNLGFTVAYSAASPIAYRLREGVPAGALDPIPESERTPTYGMRGTRFQLSDIAFSDPDQQIQYSQNISLTLQHQWRGVLLEAGYVGNLARQGYIISGNDNPIPPELLSRTEIPERLRRPYTVFGSDRARVRTIETSGGISNYHSFAVMIERRFQNGFGWTFAYTLSKWIDDYGSGGGVINVGAGGSWQNRYNRASERSLSGNHVPHRVVFAPIVELPVGKGKRWLNQGGVVNAILGGWQISTIGTLQSGSPVGTVVQNGARDLLGDAAQGALLRPDLVKTDLNSPNQGQPAVGVRGIQWIEETAFAYPARYTYGTAARTLPGVLGPGFVTFDFMAAKNFRFAERWRAQFRWEMFNATNTPIWGAPAWPSTYLGAGNFGIVAAPTDSRRIMQLGLKLHW